MIIFIGFIVTSILVILARGLYVLFYEPQCAVLQCLMQIDNTQLLIFGAIILLGTYNAYLISKNSKYFLLIFEFIGTFIFAFALNFLSLSG